jgi:uncharacterized protein YycO
MKKLYLRSFIIILILLFLITITLVGIKTDYTDIDLTNIKPGDIIIGCSIRTPMPGWWDHSAIYIGNGEVINANDEGVKIYPLEIVYNRNKDIILRVNTTDDIREKAVEFAKSKVGYQFKYWPWVDKQQGNSYYCAELIWASYYNASNGTLDLDSSDPPIPNPVTPGSILQSGYTEEIASSGNYCYWPPISEVFIYFSNKL